MSFLDAVVQPRVSQHGRHNCRNCIARELIHYWHVTKKTAAVRISIVNIPAR